MTNTPLTFTTPARARDPRTIEVSFCDETLHIDRPKDATLYFAQSVIGETVSDGDRALAVLQFLEGTLTAIDRKRYFDRILDFHDPVDLQPTLDLIRGLLDRWQDWDQAPADPLVITSDYVPPAGREIPVTQEPLDLELTAHPPKDIVLLFTSASMGTGANLGQQAWSVSLFLDAALEPSDALLVARRMRDQDDDLDLEHVAEIVHGLIQRWNPAGNRAERRAAARAQV